MVKKLMSKPEVVEDRNLTVAEAAKQLGISEKTIRGWILTRKIKYSKVMSKSVRIRQSVVDAMTKEVEPLDFGKKKGPVSVGVEENHARELA